MIVSERLRDHHRDLFAQYYNPDGVSDLEEGMTLEGAKVKRHRHGRAYQVSANGRASIGRVREGVF